MGKRQFPHLRFQPDVDWEHVNPELLRRLNRLARSLKTTITVTSGYRSVKEQKDIYNSGVRPAAKPGHSQHNFGQAVDATLANGQGVASVGQKKLKRFGLEAFDAKNDPVHVELLGNFKKTRGGDSSATAYYSESGANPRNTDAPPEPAEPSNPTLPNYDEPTQPSRPEDIQLPGATARYAESPEPGSGYLPGRGRKRLASVWADIASLPNSSLESKRYAEAAKFYEES